MGRLKLLERSSDPPFSQVLLNSLLSQLQGLCRLLRLALQNLLLALPWNYQIWPVLLKLLELLVWVKDLAVVDSSYDFLNDYYMVYHVTHFCCPGNYPIESLLYVTYQ